jgi:hypothetical protein
MQVIKKYKFYLIGAGILLLILGGVFWFLKGRQPTEPEEIPEELAPEWSLEERPYITLTPRDDGHEFKLGIEGIRDTELVDYELVYFANDISRGVTGTIELEGKTSAERDLLLGSCSKNVCKYDENVTEGTLSLRFQNSEGQVRKYELAFHLQTGDEGAVGLTSGDGNFSFVGKLPTAEYYLTLSTVGLPEMPQEELLAGPYAVFTSASKKVSGKVNLKLEEGMEEAQVLAWNSAQQTWEDLGGEIKNHFVSASVESLTTYVAVSLE